MRGWHGAWPNLVVGGAGLRISSCSGLQRFRNGLRGGVIVLIELPGKPRLLTEDASTMIGEGSEKRAFGRSALLFDQLHGVNRAEGDAQERRQFRPRLNLEKVGSTLRHTLIHRHGRFSSKERGI